MNKVVVAGETQNVGRPLTPECPNSFQEADQKALEELLLGNDDLEHLERLLDKFNIFEAVGAVHQELRHSDFLAYLLDPQGNHGLRDIFAKRFIQRVLTSSPDNPAGLTAIDLEVMDFDRLEIEREWQNMDIRLLDRMNSLVVAIENKIDACEGPEQLCTYWATLCKHHPNDRKIAIYLTPDGDEPRSEKRFIPFSYTRIAELLEQLTRSRASALDADVRTLIEHYTQMLRRHIVSESEIAELCQAIYRKHRRALDMIYEHKPDRQGEIRDLLSNLIKEAPQLVQDASSKTYIRFALTEWDDVPDLKKGDGRWTPSKRILLFEFENNLGGRERLELKLRIGRGEQTVRQRLLDIALAHKPLFNPAKVLGNTQNEIFSRTFLPPKSYSDDDFEARISERWKTFLDADLPEISGLFRSLSTEKAGAT
jgi:hypothetical protein